MIPLGDILESDPEIWLKNSLRPGLRVYVGCTRQGPTPTAVAKEVVDVGERNQVRQPSEAAVGQQRLRGASEAGPRCQRQRAADADASHAERRDSFDIQADVTKHE